MFIVFGSKVGFLRDVIRGMFHPNFDSFPTSSRHPTDTRIICAVCVAAHLHSGNEKFRDRARSRGLDAVGTLARDLVTLQVMRRELKFNGGGLQK
jgi:hypothetical protein